MKILIVGEFSGYAKHLKNGFKKLGHQVTIVMAPDSFKKFQGDKDDIVYGYNLWLCGKQIKGSARILAPFRSIWIRWKLYRLCKGGLLDLIVVINHDFVTTRLNKPGTAQSFIEDQLRRGVKLILTECGSTPADCFNHLLFWKQRGREIILEDNRYSFLLDNCHAIIPSAYGYYENLMAYADYHPFDTTKIHHAIPLPITIDKDCTITPCYDRKVVIFHGIIRPVDKGTSFILEAMKRLEEEMPEKVECIAKGGMPYDEYIKLFDRMDILVDQTYGNGWGMNAIIGAMNGKCVLTPCGPETVDNMGLPYSPFVQIGPDSEQIYLTLKELVLDPERIERIKKESRSFAEDYCESSLIAKRFLVAVDLEPGR